MHHWNIIKLINHVAMMMMTMTTIMTIMMTEIVHPFYTGTHLWDFVSVVVSFSLAALFVVYVFDGDKPGLTYPSLTSTHFIFVFLSATQDGRVSSLLTWNRKWGHYRMRVPSLFYCKDTMLSNNWIIVVITDQCFFYYDCDDNYNWDDNRIDMFWQIMTMIRCWNKQRKEWNKYQKHKCYRCSLLQCYLSS